MKVDGKPRWSKIDAVKTRSWTIVRLSIGFLAAAGCRTGDPMTEERFCEEYAQIECGKISELCSFEPALCQPVRVEACRQAAGRLKGGGHQFNPDNTDACLKKLREAFDKLPIKSETLKGIDDTCARVFAGVGKVNDPCQVDYDCAEGLICDKGHCGVLKTVPSLSGCANIGERCQPEEFCTNDNPNMLFMCMRRTPENAPCSPSRPCAQGLRCLNTCVQKLPLRGACTSDEECESGYCDGYLNPPACGAGLSFASGSATCQAYMSFDAGTPARANELVDAGATD